MQNNAEEASLGLSLQSMRLLLFQHNLLADGTPVQVAKDLHFRSLRRTYRRSQEKPFVWLTCPSVAKAGPARGTLVCFTVMPNPHLQVNRASKMRKAAA